MKVPTGPSWPWGLSTLPRASARSITSSRLMRASTASTSMSVPPGVVRGAPGVYARWRTRHDSGARPSRAGVLTTPRRPSAAPRGAGSAPREVFAWRCVGQGLCGGSYALLNDFGALEHDLIREGNPEGLRCFHVDHEVKGHRLLDGEDRGLGPLENAVHIVGGAMSHRQLVRRVGHQGASQYGVLPGVDSRQPMSGSEGHSPLQVHSANSSP